MSKSIWETTKQAQEWTTIWSRAQRGMGLSTPCARQQRAIIRLPSCRSIRFRFAAFYDTADCELVKLTLTANNTCYPITFQNVDHVQLSAGSCVCSDVIFIDPNIREATLSFDLPERMVSGTPLNQADRIQNEIGCIYALQGIDAITDTYLGCVAVFGDSITEQGNWTGVLAKWFEEKGYCLLNLGISGNRMLRGIEQVQLTKSEALRIGRDQACHLNSITLEKQVFGIAGKDRFARDVLSCAHLKLILSAIGINDLFQPGSFCADQKELPDLKGMQKGYEVILRQARAQQIPLVSIALTPFAGSDNHTQEKEALRIIWNQWLKSCRLHLFAVSFDCVLMNERQQLKQEFHNGDYLHPNALGGQRMAELIQQRLEEW